MIRYTNGPRHGRWSTVYAEERNAPGQPVNPSLPVATLEFGRMYSAEQRRGQVDVYDLDGRHVFSFLRHGVINGGARVAAAAVANSKGA